MLIAISVSVFGTLTQRFPRILTSKATSHTEAACNPKQKTDAFRYRPAIFLRRLISDHLIRMDFNNTSENLKRFQLY